VLQKCSVVVGYTFYIDLIQEFIADKKIISTGMKQEIDRCKQALEEVKNGSDTCIVSTGDPGLYGMAGPVLELAEGIEVEVVPGVSSAFCAASEIGAPIMHDMCTISLSDLLTPWNVIERRLKHAAQGDFVITLYNPKSQGRPKHLEKAVNILSHYKTPSTPVALVKNAGRTATASRLVTLATIDYDFVDMKTVVIIGNKTTYIQDGKMITPRGYHLTP
jgi:precorrin-3B C17-methyltransferase